MYPGYKPILLNEGYADMRLWETPELSRPKRARSPTSQLDHLLQPWKAESSQRWNSMIKGRFEAFELANFVASLSQTIKRSTSMVISIGKSYMMAALAHDFIRKTPGLCLPLHFQVCVDVKNAISSGLVKETVDRVKKAEILILDDIGAEQMSAWTKIKSRLRPNAGKSPFFTSNFNFEGIWNVILRLRAMEMKPGERVIGAWNFVEIIWKESIVDEWNHPFNEISFSVRRLGRSHQRSWPRKFFYQWADGIKLVSVLFCDCGQKQEKEEALYDLLPQEAIRNQPSFSSLLRG